MKKTSKLIAMLSIGAVLLLGSLAYFTDHTKQDIDAKMGTLGLDQLTLVANPANPALLAPGDEANFTATTKNNGNLPADIRVTYVLHADHADASQLGIALDVDGTELLAAVGKAESRTTLAPGATLKEDLKVKLASTIPNKFQDVDLNLEVIVEAKQSANTDNSTWTTLSTQTISLSNGTTQKVVIGQ